MKVLCVISLTVFLVRCVHGPTATRHAVPEASIDTFFEVIERRDFHEMARTGKEVFAEGLYIPNHAALFAGFASSTPRQGHIRYVLYDFRGEASAGQVYLALEQDSGRIVEFNSFEAWFDPIKPEDHPLPGAPDRIDGAPVSVSTDKPFYGTGEPIVVTIANDLDSPITYYDGCALRLCGYRDGEWGCIWKECHGETLVLAPGRTIEMRTGACPSIGTVQAFEFDCQIVSEGTPYTTRSNAFRVE